MENSAQIECDEHGLAALSLMERALEHLDQSPSALEAGCHLDLAICRLRTILGPLAPSGSSGTVNGMLPVETEFRSPASRRS